MDARTNDHQRSAGRDGERPAARRGPPLTRRVRARRSRRSGSRGSPTRGVVASGAPGAHSHPSRLGGTLQEGIRGGSRGHACRPRACRPPRRRRPPFRGIREPLRARRHGRRRRAPAHAARLRDLATAPATRSSCGRRTSSYPGCLATQATSTRNARCSKSEYRKWQERDELFSSQVLWILAWLELWAGHWELAAEYAARARDVSVQYGVERNQDHIPITWIAAHRGQLELAQDESEQALKLCEEQIGFHPPMLEAVPGLVALWRGDAATAAERLGEADQQAAALGWGAPNARPWTADYAEALLELGRIDDAVRVIELWEADAMRLGRDRVLAQVTRCRGLVAAARGAVDEAVSLLEQAVARTRRWAMLRTRSRAARARGRTQASAAEAPRSRGDRGSTRRVRDARRLHVGGEGAWGARAHQRSHARGRADCGRAPGCRPGRRGPDEPGGRRRAVPR